MAEHKDAASTTAPATANPAPKPRSTTRKSTAVPKPTVSSGRTTRSQTKALGLDDVNVNLKTLETRGLYVFDTRGDGMYIHANGLHLATEGLTMIRQLSLLCSLRPNVR
jgi:hypothetical protein